jgi:hypothetical protein
MSEEEINAVLEDMDGELVREALALLLAEGREQPPPAAVPGFVNFAQAVLFLKENYDFAELELFSTEAGLVYVTTDARRILLTDISLPNEKPARAGDAPKASGGDSAEWQEAAVRETPKTAYGPAGRFSRLEM